MGTRGQLGIQDVFVNAKSRFFHHLGNRSTNNDLPRPSLPGLSSSDHPRLPVDLQQVELTIDGLDRRRLSPSIQKLSGQSQVKGIGQQLSESRWSSYDELVEARSR